MAGTHRRFWTVPQSSSSSEHVPRGDHCRFPGLAATPCRCPGLPLGCPTPREPTPPPPPPLSLADVAATPMLSGCLETFSEARGRNPGGVVTGRRQACAQCGRSSSPTPTSPWARESLGQPVPESGLQLGPVGRWTWVRRPRKGLMPKYNSFMVRVGQRRKHNEIFTFDPDTAPRNSGCQGLFRVPCGVQQHPARPGRGWT